MAKKLVSVFSRISLVLIAYVVPTVLHGASIPFDPGGFIASKVNYATSPGIISQYVQLVNIALGLLGLFFFGVLFWGGYLWMTAGGNQDQLKKAKKLVTRAAIGVLLIVFSTAIVVRYVQLLVNTLQGAPNP